MLNRLPEGTVDQVEGTPSNDDAECVVYPEIWKEPDPDFRDTHDICKGLMESFECLLDICHRNKMKVWADWGTLLGIVRHGNVIPWDIDGDVCLMKEEYDALVTRFKQQAGMIRSLRLDLLCYTQPDSCCIVENRYYPHYAVYIDMVSMQVKGDKVVADMDHPPLNIHHDKDYLAVYDTTVKDLLPMKKMPLVGTWVWVPDNVEGRLESWYGDRSTYMSYPDDEYKRWKEGPFYFPIRLTSPFTLGQVVTSSDDLTRLMVSGQPFTANAEVVNGLQACNPSSMADGITPMHVVVEADPDGVAGKWLKLESGHATACLLSPADLEAAAAGGLSREQLSAMKLFTDMVVAADHLLWGRVVQCLLEEKQLLYVPAGWACRLAVYA